MTNPKYKLGDRVKLQAFGSESNIEEGTVVEVQNKKDGVNYTIKTERTRYEQRWEDEILGKA